MAWLETHQGIENHPKRKMLSSLMKWDKHNTMGRLLSFWFWCLDYAPTGDLSKWNDALLAESVGLNADEGKAFVDAMVQSGWIDRRNGMFRVHDWVEYAGRYLRDSKFRHQPKKWKEVMRLYKGKCQPTIRRQFADNSPIVGSTLPDPTLPNQQKESTLSGKPDAVEVLEFLNQKTGRYYRPVDTTLKMISERLKSGVTVSQCKQVIAVKARKWRGDPKMDEYLRPKTLFNKTNFEQYLGELVYAAADSENVP